ncbi:MAG: hypothetical protein HC893_09480 [Chloroflexaceae bacterium]|nr:hypothetical protein [Chloroflexaceae bacterium]NJL34042.1 hypothetical protein [Chloroflexaceae bacterium]NJO05025.1 hypothetical protein [Chloroflexaceae bacterium]NJO82581.1 hypothetical protein [Blastochloris sp.]
MQAIDYPIATIRYECEDMYGFLSTLRAGVFSEERYRNLLQALQTYRAAIHNNDMIDRIVAMDLYYLDIEFSGALQYFVTQSNYYHIVDAQLECSELIIAILTPEWLLVEEHNKQ